MMLIILVCNNNNYNNNNNNTNRQTALVKLRINFSEYIEGKAELLNC